MKRKLIDRLISATEKRIEKLQARLDKLHDMRYAEWRKRNPLTDEEKKTISILAERAKNIELPEFKMYEGYKPGDFLLGRFPGSNKQLDKKAFRK